MKWLPFLFITLISLCCKAKIKTKTLDKKIQNEKEIIYKYNDTVKMPVGMLDPDIDTGYFKGDIPEKIDKIEKEDTTILYNFLATLITNKNIKLVDSETLSHSIFIDQKRKVRFDTLRNSKTIIISKYKFKDPEYQQISIDGIPLKDYKGTGRDIMKGEPIDIDPFSFRHFSFGEEEFYYFRANEFYSVGSSMGNVDWHLIYNLKYKKLFCFESCRFGYMLFGDADGDNKLDYLDFDNDDFCTTVPCSDSVTIHLYSSNRKGGFDLQKDPKGIPYFIQGNTGEDFSEDSFIIKRFHWFKTIN